LHFFPLDIIVVFVVFIIIVVEIGTRGMVTEAFITTCAFVIVAVRVLEVDAAAENHYDFFGSERNI